MFIGLRYCQIGVGCYCFIHSKGNARACYKDKANSVPHTFFILTAYLWGLESINIIIMTKMHYDGKGPQLSEFFIFFIVMVIIGIVAWLFS